MATFDADALWRCYSLHCLIDTPRGKSFNSVQPVLGVPPPKKSIYSSGSNLILPLLVFFFPRPTPLPHHHPPRHRTHEWPTFCQHDVGVQFTTAREFNRSSIARHCHRRRQRPRQETRIRQRPHGDAHLQSGLFGRDHGQSHDTWPQVVLRRFFKCIDEGEGKLVVGDKWDRIGGLRV